MAKISSQTRKALWGRAGARCSYPKCHQNLVLNCSKPSKIAIVGEEAHIISKSKKGPRGKATIEKERVNLYENLILLCPTHHAIVDGHVEQYTVSTLREMKLKHEEKISSLYSLDENSEYHFIPDKRYSRFCSNRLVHLWKYPEAQIMCESFGSDPIEVAPGIWRGTGLVFKRFVKGVVDSSALELVLSASEAKPEIEYHCDKEALEITNFTYDPRYTEPVPFITSRYEHKIPLQKAISTLRLLPDSTPFELVMNKIKRSLNSFKFQEAETNLFHLRNIGLTTPRKALQWVRELNKYKNVDGIIAEDLEEIKEQFKLVIKTEKV